MERQNNEHKEVNALTRIYDLLLWIIPVLEKFPKTQKFLLADRIETMLLDIMELVIQAVYTRDKAMYLRQPFCRTNHCLPTRGW